MSDSASRRRKNVFFTIAALLGVWGVLGALDVANQPIGSGYSTDEDSVTSVEDGSPAAIAGMQVGDQLLSVPVDGRRRCLGTPRPCRYRRDPRDRR